LFNIIKYCINNYKALYTNL